MNKTLKRILIGLGIFVLLIAILGGGFFYKFNSETSKMTPVETGNISENIFALKDEFANMYLIKTGEKYIAVDTGKDIEIVKAELKKLNVNPENVVAILLTHSDMDHVAGIPLFKNAKIYMAKYEEKMLNGEEQKVPGMNNEISRKDYILLNDNQNLEINGTKIHCILTEGHTSGSMCFQINDKYLFTGDILSLHNGKLGESVKFFDLNHDKTTKSISLVTKLPNVQYILTSHWGISNDYTNAVKDWKE